VVIAHVRVIEIAEQAHGSVAMRDPLSGRLEFEIFGARAGDIRVEMDTVGHFGHQHFGEAG